MKTHFSNLRFPSRPSALATLLDSGLGFGVASGSATEALAASVFSLEVSSEVEFVIGAEINALIWNGKKNKQEKKKHEERRMRVHRLFHPFILGLY